MKVTMTIGWRSIAELLVAIVACDGDDEYNSTPTSLQLIAYDQKCMPYADWTYVSINIDYIAIP